MKVKLEKLYKECLEELKLIDIDLDEKIVGEIDISFSKRKTKRYGCCKQEEPDKSTAYREKKTIHYKKYNKHHIEISKWLMDLNSDIIKNTIIHELIHCLPNCNNHGKDFKKYCKLINEKLGYNISRLGNKKEDYEKSNLEFKENLKFKYTIICENCGLIYYRHRLAKNFVRKYRCGKCRGKLRVLN